MISLCGDWNGLDSDLSGFVGLLVLLIFRTFLGFRCSVLISSTLTSYRPILSTCSSPMEAVLLDLMSDLDLASLVGGEGGVTGLGCGVVAVDCTTPCAHLSMSLKSRAFRHDCMRKRGTCKQGMIPCKQYQHQV